MIKEDYVSLDSAKLLKEKGFDWEVHRSYLVNDNVFIPVDISDVPLRKDAIRIPTIQMAMKWLREKEIFIEITHDIFPSSHTYKYHYSVFCTKLEFYYSSNAYNSYEEACEAAIKYCLENLI